MHIFVYDFKIRKWITQYTALIAQLPTSKFYPLYNEIKFLSHFMGCTVFFPYKHVSEIKCVRKYYERNVSNQYSLKIVGKRCIKCFSSEDYSATTLLHSFSVLHFSLRVCGGVFRSPCIHGVHFWWKSVCERMTVCVCFCSGVCLLIREREFECERGYVFPAFKFYRSLYLTVH